MKRQCLIISAGALPIAVIALFPSEWWISLLMLANVVAVACVITSVMLLLNAQKANQEEPLLGNYGWRLDRQIEGNCLNN